MPRPLAHAEEFTLPSVHRDFGEWRQGRSYYAVWVLDVAVPELLARSARLRTRFAGQLLPDYCRQPHLTVSLCGFPVLRPALPDDYGLGAFAGQVKALLGTKLAPFVIDIGRPASFSSTAYFPVADPTGGIASLRRAFGVEAPSGDCSYVPHVSFGLYRQRLALAPLLAQMQAFDGGETLRLEISRLAWMTYEAARIGGPLSLVAEFDLSRSCLDIVDSSRLAELFGERWQETVFA